MPKTSPKSPAISVCPILLQTIHTQTIPIGPDMRANDKVDAIDGTRPVKENPSANTFHAEKCLFNSCWQPSLAAKN